MRVAYGAQKRKEDNSQRCNGSGKAQGATDVHNIRNRVERPAMTLPSRPQED